MDVREEKSRIIEVPVNQEKGLVRRREVKEVEGLSVKTTRCLIRPRSR